VARSGLYKEVPTPQDDVLQRIQKGLIDALNTLTNDDDILRVPVVTMVVTGNIQAGKSVVVFTGAPAQVLTLPQAKSQGGVVSSIVIVANPSPNALTVNPTSGDTINGAPVGYAIAADNVAYFTSDGVNEWLAMGGGSGVTIDQVKMTVGLRG
jgi:hypothetical protein